MSDEAFPYLIRPMQVQDIPEVMEIERDCFTMPWSSRAYRYEIEENPLSWHVVARLAGRRRKPGLWDKLLDSLPGVDPRTPIIGYGGFWMMVDEAHISTLAVAPPHRRKGVAELILLSMMAEAERRGAAHITLEVRVSNLPAQELYAKYGFTVQGRRVRYYSDNSEDAYIMTTPALADLSYRQRLHSLSESLSERLKRAPSLAQSY